ncbi:MAG: hypothetical protein CMM18_00290, partial [Rhodospirillaceae bacterium]|nr:hypothetical protein [Rhodospirillaceae bacterium]
IISAIFVLCLFNSSAFAKQNENEIIIAANNIYYDKNDNTVTARGNVEIVLKDKVLFADKIVYFQDSDTITAEGNISLLQENGNVFFANSLELSNQMSEGIIESFKALLKSDARFAAQSAIRKNEIVIMNNAVYSPCKPCEGEKNNKPLWQIRAKEIIHDEQKKEIQYNHARFEIRGVPVFYTPIFSHPDSTIEKKTGFLMPTQGRSTQLGTTVSIPFFINFTPNFDITLESKFTSKEGGIIGTEMRHKTKNGFYKLEGSLTNPDKRDESNQKLTGRNQRSHFFGSGNFKWDETWNWGFRAAISSDDTYLRKYNINSSDILQNNLFIEGINGKNYANLNTYFFQGLRIEDDPGETPIIFPLLEHRYISEPNDIGLLFKLNSNFVHLSRKEGIDSSRLSFRGGWHLPSTSKIGDILTLSLEFKADSYITNDIPSDNDSSIVNNNEFVYRLIPQLSGEWSWPIIKTEKDSNQLIEPLISFAISPYGGNPSKIPNEDSRSFEFDDTNVFSVNRFPGIDRIEGGPRINLGLKYGIYGKKSGSMNFLIGQVYRLKSDDTFAERSGLENRSSDYVGRISVSPQKNLNYYQRLRLDKNKLSLRRNEIGLDLGPKNYKFNLTYISLNRELTADELVDREEISASGSTKISDNWFLKGTTRRDLTSDGGMINSGASIEYLDDCFIFIINFDRNFTRDRDLQPSSSITFRVKLKNLG